MTKDINIAIFALIISLISTVIAVFVNGLEFEEISFSNPAILGTNMLWATVIAWMIWDLYRGKNIKWSLILVVLVILIFLIWEVIEYGFGLAQGFYSLEIIMLLVAYIFTQTTKSKKWFESKNV